MFPIKKCIRDINKNLLQPYGTYTGVATQSAQEVNTIFIKLLNYNELKFKQLLKQLNKFLDKIHYADSYKYLITYKTSLNNQPLLDGLYICFYSTPQEYQNALKVDLTMALESLLRIQQQVLKKKESILEISKAMLVNKKKFNL